MVEIETVYKFKGIPGLHADMKGDFFYNGVPVQKVYNNGNIPAPAEQKQNENA